MTAALAPHVLAMADALEASLRFGSLYDANAFTVNRTSIDLAVRHALRDGNEPYAREAGFGQTYLLVGLRAVPCAPGTTRPEADALLLAAAAPTRGCDLCPFGKPPAVGLLPVPAGATVVAVSLCHNCWQSLTKAMPRAHFVRTTGQC